MAIEQSIAVAPDSTGKKVRNLEITAVSPSGALNTVQMQVVSIADENGAVLNLDFAVVAQVALQMHWLQRICGALEELTGGTYYAQKGEDLSDPHVDPDVPTT